MKRRTGTCTRDCPLFCIRACRMGGDEDEIKDKTDSRIYDRDDSADTVYNHRNDGICTAGGEWNPGSVSDRCVFYSSGSDLLDLPDSFSSACETAGSSA